MSVTRLNGTAPATRKQVKQQPPSGRRIDKPDPARLAELVVATWLEVRARRRPLSQIRPLLAPALYRQLCRQLEPFGPEPAPAAQIRSVFTCSPSTSTLEASVLVGRAGRVTAIAVRIERYRGIWRVVEMTAPEAGLRPLGTTANHDARRVKPRLTA